jgi:intracellular sulfur oxidation DsrE/DsrF family protein
LLPFTVRTEDGLYHAFCSIPVGIIKKEIDPMRVLILAALTTFLFAASTPMSAHAARPDDRVALKGVTSGKGIFDINLIDVEKLPLYLQVIKETNDGLKNQGVKPNLVVAFRGEAVRFVSSNRTEFTPEQKVSLANADALIQELMKRGVRFEACAVATRLFKVDNATILPSVRVVGNTFISLIGYQSRGYALIPIQ